ncbi:MAG: class I mannose-6-phosphate isomerase [Bacteroides sp.]|nr:class I mannose-6-phosphate isomerase [Bacteroides sp.]
MSWKNEPFLLSPAGKDYLWGGDRLNLDFHKNIDLSPLAETWECSTHPDGLSMVASGPHKGLNLRRVLAEHPEYLGSHASATGAQTNNGSRELPVLVKLIDARQKLSVQVHPDDDYAGRYEQGSLGKSEMWYVLDAVPGAHLIYGFTRTMSESLVRQSLQQGDIEKYLRKVPVQKDDVFFVKAGTVHAIGAGILLAEVQENSNLTYRLYDFDRTDKNGLKRPLHIDKALQVADLTGGANPRQPIRVLRYRPGYASEFLCRCKYFQVERILINTSADAPCDCSTTEYSFRILLCPEGRGSLLFGSKILSFDKGDCMFLPAASCPIGICGNAVLLCISC